MQQGYFAEGALGYRQFTAGQIDASTLLSAITGGIPAGAIMVLISPEAQAIRYRDDGVAPTATVGQPLAVGATLIYTANNLATLRVISQTAGAILNCTFYRQGAG